MTWENYRCNVVYTIWDELGNINYRHWCSKLVYTLCQLCTKSNCSLCMLQRHKFEKYLIFLGIMNHLFGEKDFNICSIYFLMIGICHFLLFLLVLFLLLLVVWRSLSTCRCWHSTGMHTVLSVDEHPPRGLCSHTYDGQSLKVLPLIGAVTVCVLSVWKFYRSLLFF